MAIATPPASAHSMPDPQPPAQPLRRRARLDALLLVFLLALAAQQIAGLPSVAAVGLGSMVVAVFLGAAYGNLMPGHMPADWSAGISLAGRRLLRIAIVLYGLRISVQELISVGLPGLGLATVMVLGTLAIGVGVGRLLRIDRETALLATAGSAICGAAAVLAFESTLRSAPHKATVAVATVVLFGTVSVVVYPILYHAGWFDLDGTALGLYVGASVHEVAQVVATAAAIDPAALQSATIVKMARVALLVPVLLVLGLWLSRQGAAARGTGSRPPVPWFVIGFFAMILLNSTGLVPAALIEAINPLVIFAMTMAMAALGIETRVSRMREAGPRVLLLAFLLFAWLLVGGYAATVAFMRLA